MIRSIWGEINNIDMENIMLELQTPNGEVGTLERWLNKRTRGNMCCIRSDVLGMKEGSK